MNTLLTIVGTTGVGKTSLAVELSKRFDGELVSADSRQIYIGMDIATGKETGQGQWEQYHGRKTLMIERVPIHGLDIIAPDKEFSVHDWMEHVKPIIGEIKDRGKLPIIVGGTGFYLQALQGNIDTLSTRPNQKLRKELFLLPVKEMQARLRLVGSTRWDSMNNSDKQNPMRLVRAIEVAESGKSEVKDFGSKIDGYDLNMVGLTMERTTLYAKVDSRIDRMFEDGLIEETKQLLAHYDRHLPSMTGIGYAEVAAYLSGDISLSEAIQKMKWRTHAYIRRQQTWFRKQQVQWVDVGQPDWHKEVFTIVE